MWNIYSKSYLKHNRTVGISIIIAVFISSFFISSVCCIFYNLWTDNIQRIVDKEGDWHVKITAQISPEQLQALKQYEAVADVSATDVPATDVPIPDIPAADVPVPDIPAADIPVSKISGNIQTLSIRFKHPHTVYEDLPRALQAAGLMPDDRADIREIQYHTALLTQYYAYSAEDKKDPPLLLTFYLVVMTAVCISLFMIIYNAFGITMNSRLHQLGILQTVGATPRQIRTALMQEACVLSLLPIAAGTAAGVAANALFIRYSNRIGDILPYRTDAVFTYSPMVLLLTVAGCILTVFLAAGAAARALSRVTPLDAVRCLPEQPDERIRRYRFLSFLFGIEGELALKSLYSRRKSYRTAGISLTLSFLVFGVFLNFMTLSDISTQQAYFERYQDAWDLMVITDGNRIDLSLLETIRGIGQVTDCTGYRKVDASTLIPSATLSGELKQIGGLEVLKNTGIEKTGDQYIVRTPILILDDESYRNYCRQIGADDTIYEMPAAITVNRIWDNANSDFRDRKFLPFIDEGEKTGRAGDELRTGLSYFELYETDRGSGPVGSLRIAGFTDRPPTLRESFDYFGLLQVMSLTSFRSLDIRSDSGETCYRVLTGPDDAMDQTEHRLAELMEQRGGDYTIENRIMEEQYNRLARNGLNRIMGLFCGMLAVIGIANVFANTLGALAQRKREFARYLSVGLTPGGMKKILLIEALLVSLRPVLVILPLNIAFVLFAVHEKYGEFLNIMPVMPLVAMAFLVCAAVGLAYWLAGKCILRANIAKELKDDTMT